MNAKKKQQNQTAMSAAAATIDNGPQLAELAKQLSDLKEAVNILVSQITMLRSELNKK